MSDPTWQERFGQVFQRGVSAWEAGRRSPRAMFGPEDEAFLASLGGTTQELFDFVDDLLRYGEPDLATVLAITGIQRDHFIGALGGKPTGRIASMSDLPAKTDAVDGIPWLPRLIAKARLKLRGEMPPELMYGCAGDRPFLRRMRMDLPGFLALVRDHGDDDRRIVDEVKRRAGID